MMKLFLVSAALFCSIGQTSAQANVDEATLIFKRPVAIIAGDGFYDTKIVVNDTEVCEINTSASNIETCIYKAKPGEVRVLVSTSRAGAYENVFDVVKGKTYTLVVYMKSYQMYDMLWEEISTKVIANKSKHKESDEYKPFFFKALVISIK